MKQNIKLITLLMVVITLFSYTTVAQKLNCLDCHENLIAGTAHDKVAACGDCHSDIINEDHTEQKVKKVDCSKCHAALGTQVAKDVHHSLMNLPEEKTPTCKSCHGTHKIKNLEKVGDKEKEFCAKCHKTNILGAIYHTSSKLSDGCLECHNNVDFKKSLNSSVHANMSCPNCHSYVIKNLTDHQEKPKDQPLADCYLCHSGIAAIHKESIHGISLAEGINEAAQCWDCHGSHNIVRVNSDSSLVDSKNLVSTCGKCHDDPKFIKDHRFAVKQPGKMYTQSVHGKLVEAGKVKAATCVTCHGSHDVKNRVQVGSKIASVNVPETCAECHKEITEEYKKSIHWIAVKKGVRESPSCNDCHSEHSIHAINTLDKREEIRKIQENTCLQCHQNLLLSERYGMSGKSAGSYQDSYHGLASSRGDKKAALCIDCHGVHKILPKDYSESTINEKNVVATCGKCHENATAVFSSSYSHVSKEDNSAKYIEDIVGLVYFWLIVVVIGWMVVHNLFILFHELRKRYMKSKDEIKIPRFTRNELIQHTLLLLSFIILAITGFQLKYPDSWWGRGLYHLGLDESVRQWVHRGSAVVMMVLSVYHVIYLIITSRGRDVLKGLLPNMRDLVHLINNSLYYMHLKKKQPDFDNYNYIEKMEYWALIWGTIVMGVTGLVLWFPTVVGDWAPVWFIKVSEIVHFYEAILATLAIVVWHWFFVMFHPKEYPISFTVFNGKVTLHHYKEEHRLKFNNVIVQWMEVKKGKRNAKKMSHFTKLFIDSIKKNGIDVDEFINSEIEKDENLKKRISEI